MRYWSTVRKSHCMILTVHKHAQLPAVRLHAFAHLHRTKSGKYACSTAFSTTYTLGDNHDRPRLRLSTVMCVKDLVPLSRRPTCAQHSLDRPCHGRSLNLFSYMGCNPALEASVGLDQSSTHVSFFCRMPFNGSLEQRQDNESRNVCNAIWPESLDKISISLWRPCFESMVNSCTQPLR